MLRSFVRQEWHTQLRSSRFVLLSTVYILIASSPLIVASIVARRGRFFVGAAAFAESLLLLQPLATSLLAALLTVDAVSREIDDGSFAVTSINPMSNIGYIVRRWIVLLLFILPISILPQIAGWGAAQYFHAGFSPLPFLLRWLIFVAPPVVVISAFALGIGTITGRTLVAAILTFLLVIVTLGFGNDTLARFHRTLEGPGAFIGFQVDPYNEATWILRGFSKAARFGTDAGFEVFEAVQDALPPAALPTGISLVVLAGASAFLRRTRRDVRPWPVRPDHPLRTYLAMINRVRAEYAPEPKLPAVDLAAMAASALALALSITYLLERSSRYETMAAERFAAESSAAPEPMPASLRPLRLIVHANLEAGGLLTSSSELTIRNEGPVPQRFLSFQLNHALKVERVGVSRGLVTTSRLWDRIGAKLTPPIGPGESRRVLFSIKGRPAFEEFNLGGRGSFSDRYRHYQHATEAVDLSDLSRSSTIRLVTPIRVELTAADLIPVPRYTPWTLVVTGFDERRLGMPVEDGVRPATDLQMSIRGPVGSVIADSCGSIVRGGDRLRSRCTMPIVDYRLAGGQLDLIAEGGRAVLAVIPEHRPLATINAPEFVESADLARSAWPGLLLPSHLVFLERPMRSTDSWLRGSRSWGPPQEIESSGALQIIAEVSFRGRRAFGAVPIAVDLIAQSLSSQRPIEPTEQRFVTTFFSGAAARRLGFGKNRGAVVVGGMPDTRPLLHGDSGVNDRMRGVLAYLEYLAGPDRLVEGINRFVEGGRAGPGTARELFRDIEGTARIPLDRFYSDFIEGEALPVLTLKHVEFRHAGSDWVVSGLLENTGSGQLFCPLVLRTEFEPVRKTIVIDSHQSVAFSFTTRYGPRAVQLDPDRVCYRHAAIGAVDAVEYQGGA
jgi:hypothetical protein